MSNNASAATLALLEAAAAAGYAPSIHNTQPWRWRQIGTVLDLHLARDRVLASADPDARLATLSCGIALHHARVALAAQGWRVTVVRQPDRLDRDHLAQVHIEGRAPGDPRSVLHLRTIPFLRTDLRPVTAEPVTPEQVQLIAAAVTGEGTWLHTLHPDQVLEMAGAAGDPAERREPADWTSGPGRDARHHSESPIGIEPDKAAVFVLLYGRADEPLNWIHAGEALSAGWLTATQHGVSVLPHSAPIELPAGRRAMRAMLTSTGHPYLVLRLGTVDPADAGLAQTPRRPASQTIDRS